MSSLRPIVVPRDDLLDDPRFWGQLYWSCLEAYMGDAFEDGRLYFLGVDSQAANDFLHNLCETSVGEGCFPQISVTVPLRNGWRAGVILSCFPEDFEIQETLFPPEGEHVVISVSGGTTWLPGLRWGELLSISAAATPNLQHAHERLILLLFNSVEISRDRYEAEARLVLRECWEQSGLTVHRVDELLDRIGERCTDSRWEWSEEYGWTNHAQGSTRNPTSERGSRVLPFARRFFDSLPD